MSILSAAIKRFRGLAARDRAFEGEIADLRRQLASVQTQFESLLMGARRHYQDDPGRELVFLQIDRRVTSMTAGRWFRAIDSQLSSVPGLWPWEGGTDYLVTEPRWMRLAYKEDLSGPLIIDRGIAIHNGQVTFDGATKRDYYLMLWSEGGCGFPAILTNQTSDTSALWVSQDGALSGVCSLPFDRAFSGDFPPLVPGPVWVFWHATSATDGYWMGLPQ